MPKGHSDKYPKLRQCKWCGADYDAWSEASRYCSKVCSTREKYDKNRYDPEWFLKKRWHSAKNRAKTKSLPFDIDVEYLLYLWDEQGEACALSGDEFYLGSSEDYVCHPRSPSLDRIIPELGYTKGNVRLVTYHVNVALGEYGEEELIKLARKLIGVAR